jgi:hypothetical protein
MKVGRKIGRTSVNIVADFIPCTPRGAELRPIIQKRVNGLYFLVEFRERFDTSASEHRKAGA